MDPVPPAEGSVPAGPPNANSILNPSASSSGAALQLEINEEIRRSQSGANWFFWIAALSVFNSVVVHLNGTWTFLAGLGVTQLIDGMAKALSPNLGSAAIALALFLDLGAAGVMVVFGVMARHRHTWAFVLGMILYAVDGLLFLLVQEWLSLAFHVYALYCIYRGFSANNRLNEPQP